MTSLQEHVQAFERYMETSTTLLPSTRTRYAYEVCLFARVMAVATLEEITPTLLLDWSSALHDAKRATGTVTASATSLAVLRLYVSDLPLGMQGHELPELWANRDGGGIALVQFLGTGGQMATSGSPSL